MATRDGTRSSWSTRKKVKAEKGLWKRSPKDPMWRIRYTCGLGHMHKERVDTVKGNAEMRLAERRATVARDAAWCPTVEKQRAREQAQADVARERRRITFRQYAEDYLTTVRLTHRGWRSDESRVNGLVECFGDMMLNQVSPADVERFLDGLLKTRKPATVNRWRILLQAMLTRAKRHGLLSVNPVQGVAKRPEPEGRTLYLLPEDKAQDEPAIRAALRPDLRPLFTVSVHTGLRWSEQLALRWRDVDFFTGCITVPMSKSGRSRQVPMNSTVRSTLMDLAGQRHRPDDPEERVFRCSYGKADHFFPGAVLRAQDALRKAEQDASRLEGYTWHCNRHTFASRLVMAGVDLRAVQVLGGWQDLKMVARYSHLSPDHLRAAVERLVSPATAVELARN
jgi:site-specific recombinase XerD